MALLTIDKEKCKQDGFCASDCPAGIIYFRGQGSYPRLMKNAESACLRCGHCVAVCPHGALDHAEVPLDACPPIDRELRVTEAQAIQFLRSRRSVRRFKDKPVEPAVVQRLVEIGRYAPTGSNCQLVEWVVITDKIRLKQLVEQTVGWMRGVLEADPQSKAIPYIPKLLMAWERGEDVILRSAPCLVTAMAPRHDRNGMVELSLAFSYLELAAPLHGLGTCWAGLLQGAMAASADLRRIVGVPEEYSHYYPMMIGYSDVTYHRLVARKEPKITWK